MALEINVWLYGTRAEKVKTNKKLVRLSSDEISRAKAFHIFVRKTSRSQWVRVTDEVEMIPSSIRSKLDKEIYIESYTQAVQEQLAPAKREVPAPKKKEPKKKEPKPEPLPEKLKLPPIPKPPRIQFTKKQFEAQIRRILYDELDVTNTKWSDERADAFIDKLWKSFKHAPHLLVSENFRRGLVTQELQNIKSKKAKKKKKELEEIFREKLQKKELSLNAMVGGQVDIKFKEVFNKTRMRSPDDQTIAVLDRDQIVEVDRQKAFAQVVVDYDKSIAISATDILGKKTIADEAFAKVRADVENLFNESIEKGLFRPGKEPEYSVRLLVPLISSKGDIPTDQLSKKGKKRLGYGYSTVRQTVKTKEDLKLMLDNLFDSVKPAMARYVRLNNARGFMISGFTIERLIG